MIVIPVWAFQLSGLADEDVNDIIASFASDVLESYIHLYDVCENDYILSHHRPPDSILILFPLLPFIFKSPYPFILDIISL